MRCSVRLAVCALVMAVLVPPVPAAEKQAKFPPDETLTVPSFTFTTEQFLRGDVASGTPVTLTAELRLPNWDDGLPVVVLLHGSGGRAVRHSSGLPSSTRWASRR